MQNCKVKTKPLYIKISTLAWTERYIGFICRFIATFNHCLGFRVSQKNSVRVFSLPQAELCRGVRHALSTSGCLLTFNPGLGGKRFNFLHLEKLMFFFIVCVHYQRVKKVACNYQCFFFQLLSPNRWPRWLVRFSLKNLLQLRHHLWLDFFIGFFFVKYFITFNRGI